VGFGQTKSRLQPEELEAADTVSSEKPLRVCQQTRPNGIQLRRSLSVSTDTGEASRIFIRVEIGAFITSLLWEDTAVLSRANFEHIFMPNASRLPPSIRQRRRNKTLSAYFYMEKFEFVTFCTQTISDITASLSMRIGMERQGRLEILLGIG